MIPKETYVPSKKKNDYTIKPVQVPLKKPDDIDKRDRKNVLAVTDYVEDMYALFRQQESKVCPSFMDRQPVNNPKKMRGILIDWIIGIHHKNFRLCPETLYLTVHMLDRFLAGNQVPLNKLQLVGVTALLIASKYEDIYPPAVQDLSYITGNAVNPEEILDMETTILKDLDYRISKPTAHTFLVRYTRAGHANVELAQSASYILEGTLLQADLVSAYLPSELAAASVYIARRSITGREPWTSTLVKYTGYTEDQVIPIAKKCISIENKFHEVDHKYRRSCYGKVAVKSYGF
mgnify:CR=1 FL=1